MVLVNEQAGLTLLLTPTAPPAPARCWDLAPAEQPWRWAVELQMYRNDDPALAARMTQTLQTAGASGRRAYLLVGVGRTLINRGELAAAEAALLESARLDAAFPTPYVMLAAMRRDYAQSDQWDARVTQAQAWTRAGYRQPYNYGYILSGSTYWQDPRLTEAQRRQAIFNLLIAVENATFYSDYYIWGSRPFVAMGMYSQACAMLRQALWSLDHLPRPPAYKEKVRTQLEKQLAELERKLLTEEAVLPPLLPVEPGEPGEPGGQ